MTAHERLRAWRHALDLSQKALADRLDCSQSMVSLLEDGERGPGLRLAIAIERESEAWEFGPIQLAEWPEARARDTGDEAAE